MTRREQVLAAGVAGLVVLWGGWKLYGRYNAGLSARRSQVNEAQEKLGNAELALAIGRDAVKKIERAQERSLPADRDKALTSYKAWLLAKAKSAGLNVDNIKPAPRTTASKEFDAIGYQMEASGTLSSVVEMLYEFYHSPQLHQITRLRLQRPPGLTQLQVTLEVEALCLKGAVATDSLPEGDSKRLNLASAAAYQKSLGERDLATVYTPPRPPAPPVVRRETQLPPTPPKFDESELAKFTGSVQGGKGREAWIRVQTTGETLHLYAGDDVNVGALKGQIESIDQLWLVLKIGDKRYRVALGDSLRNGKELDADGNVKIEAASDRSKS
jgi:hypothetical protein